MNRKILPRLTLGAFCVLLYCLTATGQQVSVHLDKPHYFAGEWLFYTVRIDGIAKDSTPVLSTALLLEEHTVRHHHVMLVEGNARGYFRIPFDQASSVHVLALDLFSASESGRVEIARIPISIYNASDLPAVSSSQVDPIDEPQSLPGQLLINLSPERPRTRQRLSCRIQADGADVYQLSIAVRDRRFYQGAPTLHTHPRPHLPQDLLNSIPFSAKRTYLQEQAIWSPLIYAVQADRLAFKGVSVATDGTFDMTLPPFEGRQTFQFMDFVSSAIAIQPASIPARATTVHPLVVTDQIRAQARLWQQRNLIYQLSGQQELTPAPQRMTDEEPTLLADHVTDVTDFRLEGTLFTLYKEILAPLKFRRAKGRKFEAKMLFRQDSRNVFYKQPTTFLVNNQLTRDADYVAQIPLEDVLQVRIYSDLEKVVRHFGAIGRGGMVVIDMKDKSFTLPEDLAQPSIVLQGLQPPITYPILPDYQPDLPAVSTLLFWEPHARPDDSGRYEFEFMTSDDLTDFEIEVVAHDRAGQVLQTVKSFSVAHISTH